MKQIIWICLLIFVKEDTIVGSDVRVSEVHFQPEQIHLSYGALSSEMVVTWVTQNYTQPSLIEYGSCLSCLNITANGKSVIPFIDGGPQKRTIYIHQAKMTSLKSGTKYYYHVGGSDGWSSIYFFRAMRTDPEWSPKFAVFADMGNANAKALPLLQEQGQREQYDIILHAGDFAYDMDKDNGKVGDAFMNQIQSVAAYIPYMTCVGNHESAYNFSHYKYRFSLPNQGNQKMFYSMNVGPAHIISVNTEVYYYNDYKISGGDEAVMTQYNWLIQDLKQANLKENREKQPWIIVMGHRPMYCSNNDGPVQHCNNFHNNSVRTGFPSRGLPGLEDILYNYGVDVEFYAHEHSYERLYPVYNLSVCSGDQQPYTNPHAPVHIISGSGGDDEGQTHFDPVVYPWSAFHTMDYGFTRMNIINKTHIHFEQVSVDKGGKVIDEMTLIKTRHGAGLYNCHKKPKHQLQSVVNMV